MFINPETVVTTPNRADSRAPRRPGRAERPVVLVAEDHEDTRHMLRTMSEMCGCRVIEACDGPEAVAAAERERPDFILLSDNPSRLDSLAAARLIREGTRSRRVLIVALNSWATPNFRAAALTAGCDVCLDKPIDFQRLESLLAHLSDAPRAAVVMARDNTGNNIPCGR